MQVVYYRCMFDVCESYDYSLVYRNDIVDNRLIGR